jgi:ABC-type antimicrobial peptide transport system permease subunit
VTSVSTTVAVHGTTTLEGNLTGILSEERFSAVLLSLFAALGLLLAALGIYGVLSYSVLSRAQEIAIRVALGAEGPSLLAQYLLEGMRVAGAGLALGLGVAALAGHFARSLLFGIAPWDPGSFLGTTLVVIAAALVASTFPAHRASRVDPMRALR